MPRHLLVLAFASGLLAASCTPPPDTTADAGPTACLRDGDCPEGERCEGGLCATPDGNACQVLGCPEHKMCAPDGSCQASGAHPCAGPGDCGEGFTCASTGVCVQSCLIDPDCEAGFVCNPVVAGCVACTFDSQCSAASAAFCAPHGSCVECTGQLQCSPGSYCALAAGEAPYSCQAGCLDVADCAQGMRCDTSGGSPGACVECTTATENTDCVDPGKTYCDPDTQGCVECLQSSQCAGSAVCSPEHRCVQCTDDTHCGRAKVCDTSTYTCVDGCGDDSKCPPSTQTIEQIYCDVDAAPHGACVECLQTSHCAQGTYCAGGACVAGCDSDARCFDPRAPRCDLTKNTCVACLGDNDCPGSFTHCELSTQQCRCSDGGQSCSSSAQCGNPPQPDGTCGPNLCVAKVDCDGTWRNLPSALCSYKLCGVKNTQDVCPAGSFCRAVDDGGQRGIQCVPTQTCP